MFIFLRLGGGQSGASLEDCSVLGLEDRLGGTAWVGVVLAKIIERYPDFFLSYFIALAEDVSGVSLRYRHRTPVPYPGTFGVLCATPAIDG